MYLGKRIFLSSNAPVFYNICLSLNVKNAAPNEIIPNIQMIILNKNVINKINKNYN